ncbi:hypothetical protein LEP1GSC062_4364 [Leptospira alexanderi serovar Manhao 3 str. L 60]|uniref:Uncharacterized protein n=1 Tax=Leptospira alexanderi serovar Manhao 3 str. L 60 TaxID=1049759 RepID=V6I2I6_9LEPT|nr:hypothetical protein LEP1GSC062_4364 [Leptospira alexanderi serovar Manhao 3 str. L 60]
MLTLRNIAKFLNTKSIQNMVSLSKVIESFRIYFYLAKIFQN